MKKQQGRLKANELQERLINREAFHLVNPRTYGTASSRNERQLVKKMKSLHTQQNRRMAKIEDEIDEVKAHQKKLREVDDTTWDPRTVVEKTTDIEDVESRGEVEKQSDAFGVQTRVRKHHALGTRQDASNRLLTSVVAWDCPKSMTPYASKSDSRKYEPNGYLSKSVRQERGVNYLKTTSVVPSKESPKNSFQCGLLDIRLKRDANLSKYYNYNLMSADKVAREKRRQNTRHVRHDEKEPEQAEGSRENNLLPRKQGACRNLHTLRTDGRRHVEFVSRAGVEQDAPNYGHIIHVATTHKLANHEATDHNKGVGNHANKKTHFQEYSTAKNGAEHSRQYSSDDEIEGREESTPEPTEENWGETLRKCRYLRKAKGYETPEIALEAVFQYE